IEKAQSTSERFALVVCDLNSFKSVNDQYGHPAGNELLRNIALALRESCRSSDTIARLGGDEFAFLFPTMDEQSSESRLATLQEAIRQTSRELQIEIEISSSMGVAFYPQDGQTAEELLGVADRGMYLRKREFYGLYPQTADPIVPETVTVR
ncbi:MAG: GGDEF domain-containing protein, partial [Acidobacteriaceae bacterium]|nr:GGDEF domain-containing protein [Acidobacteriaceae bacterium]